MWGAPNTGHESKTVIRSTHMAAAGPLLNGVEVGLQFFGNTHSYY